MILSLFYLFDLLDHTNKDQEQSEQVTSVPKRPRQPRSTVPFNVTPPLLPLTDDLDQGLVSSVV